MTDAEPPADFGAAALELATIRAGRTFGRIYLARYGDPLGCGRTSSRFSDPRRRNEKNRFGVLYLGSSLKVCFLEALLRDQRNGVIGSYPIDEVELRARVYAQVAVQRALRVVDLRGDGAVRMGIPSDVAKSSHQAAARKWSLAIHEHPDAPDGIVYPSRLNGETNLAIYDRSLGKLRALSVTKLIDAPELPFVLEKLKVALVPSF